MCVAKAWEAAAEEARVRGAQLDACACILEMSVLGEADGDASLAIAIALLDLCACSGQEEPGLLRVATDDASVLLAADDTVWLREGVDTACCDVSGQGLAYSVPGAVNTFDVAVCDASGNVVDALEAGDVTVNVEGAEAVSVALSAPGRVCVCYQGALPRHAEPVALSVSVCGVAVPGCPWIVACPLGDSDILAGVPSETRIAFMHALTMEWLPTCRDFSLLYRGTRDGMTPLAFHSHCDGKGPTLVLIRCDKGYVFGGYAGASWTSRDFTFVASDDAFVLSVFGPHSAAPVRFPSPPKDARGVNGAAILCHSASGPVFFGGVGVQTCGDEPEGVFDGGCFCDIGDYFEDVLGEGKNSLTGHCFFTPVELEVFQCLL